MTTTSTISTWTNIFLFLFFFCMNYFCHYIPFCKIDLYLAEPDCDLKRKNDMEGTITSPGYPAFYHNNMECTITIIAPIADHQIMIQFTHLEIEDSPNCTFDRVSLFLDSYSGNCNASDYFLTFCYMT